MQAKQNITMAQARHVIAHFPFASMISESWQVSQLPFLLDEKEMVIYGHLARNNPHCETLAGHRQLVLFRGPHAYISPTWYQRKPAVPTWNYVSLQVSGRTTELSESAAQACMDKLLDKFEPGLRQDPELLPSSFRQKLNQAIVHFRLDIDSFHGQIKLGLHRHELDQQGVDLGLAGSSQPLAQALRTFTQFMTNA